VVGSIWPSIATGCWPSRHGFYCDRQLVRGTYEVRRFGPSDIQAPPVWELLSAAGKRCTVIDVPITRPASNLDGRQLVEWGAHDRLAPFSSTPSAFVRDVETRFGEYPVQPNCGAYMVRGDFAGLRQDLVRGVEAKAALAEDVLANDPADLCFLVFGESHCAGHQFWRVHDPSHPKYDPDLRAELGDVLEEVYITLDTALGRTVTAAGSDARVVVMLSHGMGPHYDGDHLLAEILRRLDDASGGRSWTVAARERAIRRLGRRRRVARAAVSIDGSRRFFKMPNNELYGAIRINLRGREPRGRVHSGAELDALTGMLREELLALEDPDTERPLVQEVLKTSELYNGPLLDALPDLFVDWHRDAPIRGARSAKIGTIRGSYDGHRTGDHRPGGLVLVRGPDIRPGRLAEPVPVVDLAPTLASWLDVALPGVDGTVNAGLRLGSAAPASTGPPPARQDSADGC
jgi:predicted AlkP superfamily phosphohydrolase/phosphomutase